MAQTETLTTQATANQIIFHTFREKSRGLHTQLATVNHRRPSPLFTTGGGDGGSGGGAGLSTGLGVRCYMFLKQRDQKVEALLKNK